MPSESKIIRVKTRSNEQILNKIEITFWQSKIIKYIIA